MRVAMAFAQLAAVSGMLGLLRWPSIHWALAEAYAGAAAPERTAIAAVFTGLNSYLGNYIGEFLGELSVNLFFLLSALAMLMRKAGFPRSSASSACSATRLTWSLRLLRQTITCCLCGCSPSAWGWCDSVRA